MTYTAAQFRTIEDDVMVFPVSEQSKVVLAALRIAARVAEPGLIEGAIPPPYGAQTKAELAAAIRKALMEDGK